MIGKRFEYNHEQGYEDYIYDVEDNRMMWELDCICELLNNLDEENKQVKKVLKKQLDKYTQRALLLKEPYGDVTEAIHDIANELGVDLE